MSDNSGDRQFAETMIKRLITDSKSPRDFVDEAFLLCRKLHMIEPSVGGRFGASIEFLARTQHPGETNVSQKEFIRRVSSSPGSKCEGENMRRIRYAMEEIGFIC